MKWSRHKLFSEVILISPQLFGDERGYFFEGYQTKRYTEAGITAPFVQDNYSRSKKNTLRGLHFQLNNPQGKLVGVTQGKVFDVIVDIRPHSATFGRWASFILSTEDCLQVYIPPGFAHGFLVLSDSADFYYKCTHYYDPTDEGGVIWNDPALQINWPLASHETPIVSEKDQRYQSLAQLKPEQLPG